MNENTTPESGEPQDALPPLTPVTTSALPEETVAPIAHGIEEETEISALEQHPATAAPRFSTANPHVIHTEAYSAPLPKNSRTPVEDAVALPSVPVHEFNDLAEHYPHEDISSSAEGRKWLELLMHSQHLLMRRNMFDKVQHQADSEWVQRPVIDNNRYGIAAPRFGDEKEGGPLTGERARQRMMAHLGIGVKLRLPLWHSGIYVTIKAPNDLEILDLQRLVETEKVDLGRATNGMVFSNTSVVTNMHLVDFILERVYSASVPFNNPAELKTLIATPDLYTLVWGMLCTIYPDGYPYSRPCVRGPQHCTHVTTELLMLSKLSVTNQRKLTTFQRTHMKERTNKVTLDAVKRYQKEFKFDVPDSIELVEGTRIFFRHPSLAEYEISGRAWIDALVQGVDEAFGGRISAEERNQFIISSARATAVRHYAHYIDRITVRNDKADMDNEIVDRETLEETLSDISSNEGYFNKIVNAVSEFIEQSTVSMIAIPRYRCPNCDHDQGVVVHEPDPNNPDAPVPDPTEVDAKTHPYLIPLDMSALFFTIIGRRITRALTKKMLGE